MNKYLKISFGALAIVALTGCGSSGVSPTPSEQPTSTTTVQSTSDSTTVSSADTTTTDPTFQGLKAIGGADAGLGRVEDGKYLYVYNGGDVDITTNGIMAGTVFIIDNRTTRTVIGGTTYSYSRFGAIAPSDDLSQAEVFYMGTKTTSMPATGSATYEGLVVEHDMSNTSASFNVDFGAKTIVGSAGDKSFTNGVITGADFAGDVSGSGQFQGSFFGNDAAELGGTGTSDGNAFSFGAKKI
ncbi:MAG: hypothetical protein RBR33_04475 [Sulfurovaceae bacterium]|nr:hypothetical protein [Sulfurovaceae bacterium]